MPPEIDFSSPNISEGTSSPENCPDFAETEGDWNDVPPEGDLIAPESQLWNDVPKEGAPVEKIESPWNDIPQEGAPVEKIENQWNDIPQEGDLITPESRLWNDVPQENKTEIATDDETTETQLEGLTDAEKQQIKEETGWSNEIIDHIDSMEQYDIYKKADLHEEIVNGKPCLVKNIDWNYEDPKTGKTNRELASDGRAPVDSKTGEKIELHHMGQDQNGPFVELTENTEHGDGNHSTLHPDNGESWRHEPGAKSQYNQERIDHWKSRAEGGN